MNHNETKTGFTCFHVFSVGYLVDLRCLEFSGGLIEFV